MIRTVLVLALAAISFTASAAPKVEPKAYTLTNKAEACKQGFTRAEIEFVKFAANGSVTFKYKGYPVMSPVPKQYAAQYKNTKSGDIKCLPDSED